MSCTCSNKYIQLQIPKKEKPKHSEACIRLAEFEMDRELMFKVAWESQDHSCTGPGFQHIGHGICPGYGTDRT